MISCRNVSKLLMEDGLASQGWWTRMQVRLHLAMCALCSRLARQIAQMRDAARLTGEADADLEDRLIRKLSGR